MKSARWIYLTCQPQNRNSIGSNFPISEIISNPRYMINNVIGMMQNNFISTLNIWYYTISFLRFHTTPEFTWATENLNFVHNIIKHFWSSNDPYMYKIVYTQLYVTLDIPTWDISVIEYWITTRVNASKKMCLRLLVCAH